MTIPSNREVIDDGSGAGCRVRGVAQQVIDGVTEGATRLLLKSESGALCVFNRAAGVVFTLPAIGANDVGMTFEFVVTVDASSNSYSVSTGDAAIFIGGGMSMIGDGAGEDDSFAADIAATVIIELDAAETGWQAGGSFKLTSLSTTQWAVGGFAVGTGTMETPFA